MQSCKASGSCEISLAAGPPLTQTASYSVLPCPIHFSQKQLNILIQKKLTESHPETIFVTQKKPKHTLLNTSEGNGTLGTPFLH